ncbi:MAG: hypothetical protein IKP51_09715 [Treponema sp.]|nr:hypothetical protein [Treponema sp.]
MKKSILILFFILMGLNIFSKEKRYNTITIYAVNENEFHRFPIKNNNIEKYYQWMYKCKDCVFDAERIEEHALPKDYDGAINARIDFEENGKVTTLSFYSIKGIRKELQPLFFLE